MTHMAQISLDDIPIACDLTVVPNGQGKTHENFVRHLFQNDLQEVQELENGYAFRFEADLFAPITKFIANERLCCAFFHFGLEISPAQGPIWLRLTGGEGVKAFLQTVILQQQIPPSLQR